MEPRDEAEPSSGLIVSQYVDGFQIPVTFPIEGFRSAIQYKPRPGDLFIVTYPKCGTTWAQQILLLIFRRGEPLGSPVEFYMATPFLDVRGAKSAENMPRPNAIKTHLPFHLVPWSEDVKYIYVARNPKDCCVSYFLQKKNLPRHNFKGDFDQYFDMFLSGKGDYGDYFDHLMDWYEHRNDSNVLFMTYEEIQEDIEASVLKMASFIDEEKYAEPLRKDRRMLDNILKFSSLQKMKEADQKRITAIVSMRGDEIQNSDLPEEEKRRFSKIRQELMNRKERPPDMVNTIRKGIVGDWRYFFSEDQSRRLDEKFVKRTKGTELENLWKKYMYFKRYTMSESTATLPLHSIEGLKMPLMFSADAFRSGVRYKPRPDDVFIVTYPKCGTTWAQHILLLLFSRGEPVDEKKFFSATPFLEVTGAEAAETMPRPGAIKTHLPFQRTPWSDQAKYIYITRNPKDCCVSYYHHMKNLPGHGFKGTFDEFFELFISGDVAYGDYFGNLMGWYEHRNDPNVLFMTYEEMKENPEAAIFKMALFIDEDVYAKPLREDPEKLQRLIKYSSFKHMKEEVNKFMDNLFNMPKENLLKSDLPDAMKKTFHSMREEAKLKGDKPEARTFVRKGIVGDWKNYFSEEQSKRMDQKFVERTKGTELENFWKNYM